MAENPFHPTPLCDCTDDVKRSLRDMRPAHYTLEIESFSDLQKMLKETQLKSYKSQTFEVGGYKWKLSLYPNGDEERNGKRHISMYLVIADTEALPLGWEVYVNFKLFIFDQINDKFLTIQDDSERVRRFHKVKKEWGFGNLIPQSTFQDASNGFLIHEKCVFGAEVFVMKSSGRGERITRMKNFSSSYTWKIRKFSTLTKITQSEIFTLGDLKWKLHLYPRGNGGGAGTHLSLFLKLEDSTAPAMVYVDYALTIRDQCKSNDWKNTGPNWLTPAAPGWGWNKYISLCEIRDASKGFVVKDTMIIEARILSLSMLQNYSSESPKK